jgi:hypothetical protein
MSEAKYLIISFEHNAFWAPNERGYTKVIEKAGRYTKEKAEKICLGANEYLEPTNPYEVAVLAPEVESINAGLLAACEAAERALVGMAEASKELIEGVTGRQWTYRLSYDSAINQVRAAIAAVKGTT